MNFDFQKSLNSLKELAGIAISILVDDVLVHCINTSHEYYILGSEIWKLKDPEEVFRMNETYGKVYAKFGMGPDAETAYRRMARDSWHQLPKYETEFDYYLEISHYKKASYEPEFLEIGDSVIVSFRTDKYRHSCRQYRFEPK